MAASAIKAFVFDWAGTMIDFGCCAPVVALQGAFAEADAAVARQAGEQVRLALAGAEGVGGGQCVLLDRLVRGLASRPALHRFHQDRGGGEER